MRGPMSSPGASAECRAAAAAGNRLPSEEGPRAARLRAGRKCRWRRWGRAGGGGAVAAAHNGGEMGGPPLREAPCLSFPTAQCGAPPPEGCAGSALSAGGHGHPG